MKLDQLQPILDRQPFRPFVIRLSNGHTYQVLEPRNLGAPAKVTDTLFFFGPNWWALIDTDHIAEVFNL